MKRFLYTLILLGSIFTTKAADLRETLPSYWIKSVNEDKTLAKDQVEIIVSNSRLPKILPLQQIIYSVDGLQQVADLDEQRNFKLNLNAGSHIFQFFFDEMHYEIYTDSIAFLGQHRYELELNWQMASMEIMVDKPVIYLYPSSITAVSVKVEPKGEFTFTYPHYDNAWNITAHPDGTIDLDGNQYNYLFWEAQQSIPMDAATFSEGFVVKGSNSLKFLEDKLTELGFTSKEKADFITFWGPQLIQNKHNFVHFYVNEACNQFGELTITPSPDHIYRIYMITSPLDDFNPPSFKEQVLPYFDRSGFTVIEWGGSRLKNIYLPL